MGLVKLAFSTASDFAAMPLRELLTRRALTPLSVGA